MVSVGADPILIVEDEENNVILLERAFQRAGIGHPRHVVRDGDEAVAYLEGTGEFADRSKHPLPVLVLLDLQLPRRTGLEVLERVKARRGLRRIPIVMFTSSTLDADIDRAYELGVNSYVVKPVSFERMVELVQVLERYWLALNERPRTAG